MVFVDNKTITENDCDLIALTDNGKVISYTTSDKELYAWLNESETHSWFCVDDE